MSKQQLSSEPTYIFTFACAMNIGFLSQDNYSPSELALLPATKCLSVDDYQERRNYMGASCLTEFSRVICPCQLSVCSSISISDYPR